MRKITILSLACLTATSVAAMASSQKYDGKYHGTIVNVRGMKCGISEPTERNTVIAGGNLQFVFSQAMTLTGPVQDDGSFVATGSMSNKGSISHFELKGQIAKGALNAELSSQLKECIYKVEQKKV
jgi:hypothetical protein